MGPHQASTGITPAEFADLVPGFPVLSSAGHGWSDVTVHLLRLSPLAAELPPARDHRLCLHLAGPTLIERVSEGRRDCRWSDSSCASLIPAGVPVNRSFKGRPEFLTTHIAPSLVDEVAAEAFDLDPARVCLVESMAVPDETLDRLGRLLLAEAEAEAPGGRLMADMLTRALAVWLVRRYSSRASQALADASSTALVGWRMRRVTEYMNDNLAEDLPLAQLAAVGGIGPSQFARAFRAATGEPPHRYLVRLRVERARGLLEQTELPVIEVGLRCGFGQPNHFATMFRQVTGLSPRAYRKARCT